MHEIFTRDFDLNALRAVQAQRRIAKRFHAARPRSIEGIGEQRMALHPFFDAAARLERGGNCWADRDFREWYMKRHPEVRVQSGGTKIQVGYGPKSKVQSPKSRAIVAMRGGEKRFTKVYPA